MSAATAEQPTEYYPGTSTQITVREVTPAPKSGEGDLFSRPRTGYQINGQPFPCFAIGVLARALDGRKPVTLRMWEREGLLPRTNFRSSKVQGGGKARLYTREQIEGIVEIAKEEGIYPRDSKVSIRFTNFTARVAALFREIDAAYRSTNT